MPMQMLPTEQYFEMIKELLAAEGSAFVRVTGNSMCPLLHHLRDGVIIVPPKRIRLGDIVLFERRNGRYALHRVIGKRRTSFTMAGDNQWHMEHNLPYEQIVGRVTHIVRDDRRIPVSKSSQRMYALAVTLWGWPRIYMCRAVKRLARPLKRVLGPRQE